jgi:hypothetical protein
VSTDASAEPRPASGSCFTPASCWVDPESSFEVGLIGCRSASPFAPASAAGFSDDEPPPHAEAATIAKSVIALTRQK